MKHKKLVTFALMAAMLCLPVQQARAGRIWNAVKKAAPYVAGAAAVGAIGYSIGKSRGRSQGQAMAAGRSGEQLDKNWYRVEDETTCRITHKSDSMFRDLTIEVPQSGPDACVAFVTMDMMDDKNRPVELAVLPDGTAFVPEGSVSPDEAGGVYQYHLKTGREALSLCHCVSTRSRQPANTAH